MLPFYTHVHNSLQPWILDCVLGFGFYLRWNIRELSQSLVVKNYIYNVRICENNAENDSFWRQKRPLFHPNLGLVARGCVRLYSPAIMAHYLSSLKIIEARDLLQYSIFLPRLYFSPRSRISFKEPVIQPSPYSTARCLPIS